MTMTTKMTTMKPALLPTASLRPLRRCRIASSAAAFLALLLTTAAWLSLVFSSSSSPSSPSTSFSLLSWTRFHSISSPPPLFSPLFSPPPPPPPPPPFRDPFLSSETLTSSDSQDGHSSSSPLAARHLVFGIAGSAHLWRRRREFLRLWWRPSSMHGHVWLDDLPLAKDDDDALLPPIRVSEDISRFRYTNPTGHPSGLRIARIVAESFRLGHPTARWFVLVDDDTIVCIDNLVAVLAKYDWTEMVYVGAPSESHSANTYFSHSMAFGGGGIALSYPLAEALATMQDGCLERYPRLYGSDDRLHACISELGVPLTREHGFHQWDIRGNAHGLLAAHPIAPFISIHHVETVDSFYPGLSSLESLVLFTKAMKTDPHSFLQRAIAYDKSRKLTIAVSLGYVVQVFPNIVLPRDLERSEQTYIAWNKIGHKNEFDFDTRDSYRSVCKKPILFFLKDIWKDGNITKGSYVRATGRDDLKRKVFCFPRSPPLPKVDEIQVLGTPLSKKWHLVPRRLCSKLDETRNGTLLIIVGQCKQGTFGSAANSL
ncbi:uncharacterized protein [Typha latifolia]|uniref:uncharacterized protein n=1 Tax=Typha latifolia TaxID=4733 RepID=UPI003C2C995D